MDRVSAALDCAFDSWSPGIGDPSAIGWLTVLVYAFAAWRAAVARRALADAPFEAGWTERAFWSVAALLLAFLCVNKQLDLQSLVTAIGRCDAKQAGWYDVRRVYQREFILALAAVAAGAALLGAIGLRRALGRNAVALVGFGLLAGFVMVRAVGFHHFEAALSRELMGISANGAMELGALALVVLGAGRVIGAARADEAAVKRAERRAERSATRSRRQAQRDAFEGRGRGR